MNKRLTGATYLATVLMSLESSTYLQQVGQRGGSLAPEVVSEERLPILPRQVSREVDSD